MLIVLPFHAGDEALALKNLALCKKWRLRMTIPCVLSYDSQTNPDEVRKAAGEVFTLVHDCRYDAWTGEKNWPIVQNWAWQSTARYLLKHFEGQSWYWWEADVVPLQRDWASRIEQEYIKGAKPFMGHIVKQMGHMNGAGVYPSKVADFTYKAMLTRSSPWDVVMKEETDYFTHAANGLLAHYPRFNGIKLAVVNTDTVKALRRSGAVMFHGCNDGTLHDLMLGKHPKVEPSTTTRIIEPEDLVAEWDESEAMWQHDAQRLRSLGQDIAPYKVCRQSVPPFREQNPSWESGQFNLPITSQSVHFNAGVTRDGQGRLWVMTRRWDRPRLDMGLWHSTLTACLCNDNMQIVSMQDVRPRNPRNEEFEDPRIVWHDGRFWVSYCAWIRNFSYAAKQVLSAFSGDWTQERQLHVNYGRNHWMNMTGCEKNWLFFIHEGSWHFIYSANPHLVVQVHDENRLTEYRSPFKPNWKWGEIRGGTPPVRVGDEYVSFFHSSLPWRRRQKRYHMGAYAFEAKPPFKPAWITPDPLLSGSESDTRILGGPLVIFPCGAILENGKWLVTFGVNDEAVGWTKIPHDELIKRTVKC